MDECMPMVQSLVESGTRKVPKRFIRPIFDQPSAEFEDVPIIDAKDLEKESTVKLLDKACKERGFFQLVGHDISPELIQSTREVIKGFFELPTDEKEIYSTSKHESLEGYGRFFLPSNDTTLDWGDVFFHYQPPRLIQWPNKPTAYKATMSAYEAEVRKLAIKLLAAMSRALEQEPDILSRAFGDSVFAVRSNFYPPCPEPDLVLGLSPHSDGDGITILLQDDVQGLQIKKDGKWKSVASIPGAFVVNVGDILEILTNGIYKSVEHRAVVNSSKYRISIASIYSPGDHSCLKTLLGGVPIFREMTMGEFFMKYLSGQLNGKEHLQFAKLQG